MKKRMAMVAVTGMATAIIIGAGLLNSAGASTAHAEPGGKNRVTEIYAGTSPDLPEMGAKDNVRPYIGTSPDLPEMDAKVNVPVYAGTSPDLPELDAKVSFRTYAGASPDLPEMIDEQARGATNSVEVRMPLESFAYFSIDGTNGVAPVANKVERAELRLPLESFAYFSIDGTNSVTPNASKVERVESWLPLESFAYFSIDGTNS
ncbi:MAG: hypothetical protein FI707_03975, partial [SAR202 cluster bacterium]|nr:hypothetical protein [SAR202 cluster bacterium]